MDEFFRKASEPVWQAISARFPVVYVVTWEEERLEHMLEDASLRHFGDQRAVWEWTAARGFITGPGRERNLTDPVAALTWIAECREDAIVLMKDLPSFFDTSPAVIRAVRDVYDSMADRPGTVVLSHPMTRVPTELAKELFLLELPLPDERELADLLRGLNEQEPESRKVSQAWLQACADAMNGLSSNEARDLFHHLVSGEGTEIGDAVSQVRKARARILMKDNCLEVFDKTVNIDQVGGMESLKRWIETRRDLFGHEARAAGVHPPSGVLLMGVSGCGKSLAAKVIPSAWGLPLVRLDMNLIMSGAYGTPESAWQRAIRTAEDASPLVLWIDEIENSFGYQNGVATSGNMTVFSAFLTWMQEKPEDVFVVATANRIEILPAEMLRKGRFDQLFFVDLPGPEARTQILAIHIRNQGGKPEELDLDHLSELMKGWTAAEIEQMVKAARTRAFMEGRDFGYDDLIGEIFKTVPLSRTMSEQLSELRNWSRHRAIPA